MYGQILVVIFVGLFLILLIWLVWINSFSNQFRNQGSPANKLSEQEIEKWKNRGLNGTEAGQSYNNGWVDPNNPLIINGRISYYTNHQQSDKNFNSAKVNKFELDNFYKILYDISQDNNPNLDYNHQINQLDYWHLPYGRQRKDLLNAQHDRLNSFLNEEQRKIYDLVIQGNSIFFTGSAGTGKSFLLGRIIKSLEKLNGKESIAVTATTGIAAVNINGVTLHSFSGIGVYGDTFTAEELVNKISKQKKQVWVNNWRSIKTLIIDEVSMLSGVIFDKLEWIARKIRRKHRLFGELQIVLSGDFFQLPPIKSNNYCFEAKQWKKVLPYTINLIQIYRQKEPKLVNLLNEIRFGEISAESWKTLEDLEKEPQWPDDGIKATNLVATNNEKDIINSAELNRINNKSYFFRAIDWEDKRYKGRLEILTNNCLATESLELKRGCQVMLIKNLSESLVNGSQGVVIGFETFPIVKFANGIERKIEKEEWTDETPITHLVRARRTQIPLVLSWAITIHKSQGQSIERLSINLNRVFERGQTYVALSRACSIKYLKVIGFQEKKVICDEKVKKFYQNLSILND